MVSKAQSVATPTIETLEKFVVRARRVQVHSIAKNREQLRKYARYETKIHLSLTGEIRVEEELPDEEQFESLAARLRPLLLAGESIYYIKVLNAIEAVLGDKRTPEEIAAFQELRGAWESTDIEGVTIQGYSLQTVRSDGKTAAKISDSQLAAGWLYIDLVHVDPRKAKAQATEHTLKDRFTAATRVLSRVAELTLQTLEYIGAPERQASFGFNESVWEVPVSVTPSEAPISAKVYFAEVGTAPPDLEGVPIQEIEGWKELTASGWLQFNPGGRVAVRAKHTNGETVVEAAVLNRRRTELGERVEVLLDDSALFAFEVASDGDRTVDIDLDERRPSAQTPDRMARFARLLLLFYEADSVDFEISGIPGFSVSWTARDVAEVQSLKVLDCAMTDLEIIERLSSTNLGSLSAGFSAHDLTRLRMVRLLWEGKTVWGQVREVRCKGPEGLEPRALAFPGAAVTFGGMTVPAPPTIVYSHSEVETYPIPGPPLEGEVGERSFVLRAPEGQQLVVWSPERFAAVNVEGIDALSQPVSELGEIDG